MLRAHGSQRRFFLNVVRRQRVGMGYESSPHIRRWAPGFISPLLRLLGIAGLGALRGLANGLPRVDPLLAALAAAASV